MDLSIRKMREEDLPALHALLSDEEVMRYLEPPFSPRQTSAFLKSAGLCDPPLIFAALDGGEWIGYVIDHDYDEKSREIGWVLKKDVWGRGYAKALTKLLVARAQKMGKTPLLECAPEQAASRHIALKMGFSYVGMSDGCEVYRLER